MLAKAAIILAAFYHALKDGAIENPSLNDLAHRGKMLVVETSIISFNVRSVRNLMLTMLRKSP